MKHVRGMRDGHSDILEGLDFWAPNINIFRGPRWGRGQGTFAEDPLTARMGVAFVTGVQGDDPKYYRVISTPKHFAIHSGPEPSRHKDDINVSEHDQLDTYLPAFRATVTEGRAGSVMCAYNSINGQPACVNEFLLQDQLRSKWNFKGYVVSDCEAVVNIFRDHRLSMVSEAGEPMIAERQYSISIGGGQPDSGASTIAAMFQVKGTKNCPTSLRCDFSLTSVSASKSLLE